MYIPFKPKEGKEIIKVRLIKEYDEYWSKNLKVGDITWVYPEHLDNNCLIEDNRYGGNFKTEYFEIIVEPIYEIY
jgi:hypothetical protein